MDVKVNIKLNDKLLNDTEAMKNEKTVASGWVEIDNAIKFPVSVRKYTDKKDNKEKMFVSYPQRKTGSGEYASIVYPTDKIIRQQVEDIVLQQVYQEITKGLSAPEITNVRVSPLTQERKTGSVTIKAAASITMSGFTINGIMVKEGKNGLFVQMPQYQENGAYHDTVYGTSTFVQNAIKDAVLYEYNAVISKVIEPEEEMAAEKVVKEDIQEAKEYAKQDIPPINISNVYYKDGYLQFTVKTEGAELESLFRVHDPDNGEDMKLVYIMDKEKHPHIDILWNSIESSLQEKCMKRYMELKQTLENNAAIQVNQTQKRLKV